MIIYALFGICFGTDSLLVRDVSIEYLRTFDYEKAPEKVFLVNQAEILFTKLAVMESRYLNEDRLKIMHGWTDFVASMLDRTDLEDRDLNIISGQMMNIQRFDRFSNLTSVIIELHYNILGETGIDVLSQMPPDTIENQDLIHSILMKVSLSTILKLNDSHRWLVDKSRTQLEFMDSAATILVNDCLRIQKTNPDVFIICYPMHSLLRMDLSGMTVSDLMMGEQYVEFELMVETVRSLSAGYPKRANLYELFVSKRRINHLTVSTIMDQLISGVSSLNSGRHFPDEEVSEAMVSLERVTVSVAIQGLQTNTEDIDESPVGGSLAILSLNTLLSQMQKSNIPNKEELQQILQDWLQSEPTPFLMMAITRELVKNLSSGFRWFSDRCLVSISKYFQIRRKRIDVLRYANDPRISREVKESCLELIEEFRRPSLLFKSIRPHFQALLRIAASHSVPSREEIDRLVLNATQMLSIEESKPLIEISFNPELYRSILSLLIENTEGRV
jgi:hypothetical protein